MTNKFFCPRCGYETNTKRNIKRHLYRKITCIEKYGEYEIEYLREQLRLGKEYLFIKQVTPIDPHLTPENPQLTPNLTPENPQLTPNDPEIAQLTPNDPDDSSDESSTNSKKTFTCQFCSKQLSKSCHLIRHIKRCKYNPLSDKCDPVLASKALSGLSAFGNVALFSDLYQKIQNLEDKLQKKEEELQNARKEISQLIPKVGSYNNNIVIVNFGNETLDHLNYSDIKNLIETKGAYGALPHIFEQIYFSDKAPQNKTIKIPNLNKPKLAIHHEGKWVQQDKEYVLDIAATKTTNLALEAHPQKINKVKQSYHEDDGASKKRIEGDIYNIIETDHRNKIN